MSLDEAPHILNSLNFSEMEYKVLIADDSKMLRSRLVEMLSEIKGIEVVGEAEDCPGTIEAVGRLKPDIVIQDIVMPAGNGISVLEMIKKSKLPPKVIMFTNYPYPEYRKKCMNAGADFFFSKSTEFENLIEVLKQFVQDSPFTDKTK